jgi:hypothetical protein
LKFCTDRVTIYPSQERGHLPLIDQGKDDIFYFPKKCTDRQK